MKDEGWKDGCDELWTITHSYINDPRYQQVIEKTKGMSFRSYMLVNNISRTQQQNQQRSHYDYEGGYRHNKRKEGGSGSHEVSG